MTAKVLAFQVGIAGEVDSAEVQYAVTVPFLLIESASGGILLAFSDQYLLDGGGPGRGCGGLGRGGEQHAGDDGAGCGDAKPKPVHERSPFYGCCRGAVDTLADLALD